MTTLRQAFLNALDGICYLADGDGRIIDVGQPAWRDSLRRYGVEDPGSAYVVGQRLFDIIQGAEVQVAYQRIHQAVLNGARSHVAFEMRCDGPDVRRLLRMSVSLLREPHGPAAVLYQSQLLSAVSRPWMSLFDPQRIVAEIRKNGGLPIAKICSFCHRVAWPVQDASGWILAEDYYRLGGPPEMRTSHGVCPHCAEAVLEHA
jgi:hypothetical protein